MRRILQLVIIVLIFSAISGCAGLSFAVKHSEQDGYMISEMTENYLEKSQGNGHLQFNLKQYKRGSKRTYAADMIYTYEGSFFALKDPKGVYITINNKDKFWLETKRKPVISYKGAQAVKRDKGIEDILAGNFYDRSEVNEFSKKGYSQIRAEYYISAKQVKLIAQAASVKITMENTLKKEDSPIVQSMFFDRNNLAYVRQFYNEEILGKKGNGER